MHSQLTGLEHSFLTRRQLLERVGMGVGSLALGQIMQAQASSAMSNPFAARSPQFTPTAKHVVHFFMNGGPSQIDTFDPKPALTRYIGKRLPNSLKTERPTGTAFPSPFKFRQNGQSGLEVSEIYEKVGSHADDLCVIRSMNADVPNHEPSLGLMNCGEGRLNRPSLGSWITYGLGSENNNLPSYVALCPGGMPTRRNKNWQAAFLPSIYQGTFIDSEKEQVSELIEFIKNMNLDLKQQRKQMDLLMELNQQHMLQRQKDAQLEARIQSYELAYRMQMEASDAFDIRKEPQWIIDLYGAKPGKEYAFARQCLIARRLIERGVRFIQLWTGEGQPWDSHDEILDQQRLGKQTDQPIAAFLHDIKMRGLFDDVLVIWGGEFGRTPVVEMPTPGSNLGTMRGRDHNHYGFSMWMAGGGTRGGYAHGSTDEFGFTAVEKPVHVRDLHATILHLLGFDHDSFTYRYSGLDYKLTGVGEKANVVHELIA